MTEYTENTGTCQEDSERGKATANEHTIELSAAQKRF
jgi:hypothetical protein